MPTKKEELLSLEKDKEYKYISELMEQYAGVSKEAMGVRTPGERCMYEIPRK